MRKKVKSSFIGVRLEREQQRKLIVLSLKAGKPGNMSEAIRWLIDSEPMPSIGELEELDSTQG